MALSPADVVAPTLPLELVHAIVETLERSPRPIEAGKRLSLVSRRPFRDLGQAIVFRGDPHSSLTPRLYRHLDAYPTVGKFVQHLSLRGGYGFKDDGVDLGRVVELCSRLKFLRVMVSSKSTTRIVDTLSHAECATTLQSLTIVPSGREWTDFDLDRFAFALGRMTNLETLYLRLSLPILRASTNVTRSRKPFDPPLRLKAFSFAERGPTSLSPPSFQLLPHLIPLVSPSCLESLTLESPASTSPFLLAFLSRCISLLSLTLVPLDVSIAALLPALSPILLHLHYLRHLSLPHGATPCCGDIDAPSIVQFATFLNALSTSIRALHLEGLKTPHDSYPTVVKPFLESHRRTGERNRVEDHDDEEDAADAGLRTFWCFDVRKEKRLVVGGKSDVKGGADSRASSADRAVHEWVDLPSHARKYCCIR
ncbi:hypothetical protein JCM10212_002834 [Sporobolomyces blumeae]